MRIAIAQINPTLCDFAANSQKILEYAVKAKDRHCDLVIFPESSLMGYHPFDLLELADLIKKQDRYIKLIAKAIPKDLGVLFGTITPSGLRRGKPYYNSALFMEQGKEPRLFHKELLPTGDVFDEARFIESGRADKNLITFRGNKIVISICEDIWAWPDSKGQSQYLTNPLAQISKKVKNVDLVLNLSASPYYPGKEKVREELVRKTAAAFKAPMVYCNMVGAQDEIIFDGQSFAVDRKGKELARMMPFQEDLGVVDLKKMQGMKRPEKLSESEKIRRALVLGIRDFCLKTGLKKIHFGLSGGIDSALVACMAADALGPANVKAFALPSEFNSPQGLEWAEKLAKNLGIGFQVIPIQSSFDSLRKIIDPAFGVKEFGLVHENLQARLRGLLMMSFANVSGSLLLSTCNKSESAVGYATLYGDMCGGLMPIADLTKKQVYALSRLYNLEQELIPSEIIERPPTAELRPNQKDQDSLPPYDELDAAVDRLVVNGKVGRSKADQFLLQALLRSEFKRWQAPPILKVSKHSFGRGRRWPVAQKAGSVLIASGTQSKQSKK